MKTKHSRVGLFLRRCWISASMGVFYAGTSKFELPKSLRLIGKKIYIFSPVEKSLAYDFINIYLDDEYGLNELETAPVTIVDIGANIGLFSLRAGSFFPKAKIHAYEPNPRLKCHLSKNLEQVQGDFFLEAVGSKGGNGHCIDSGDSRMGIFENGAGDSKMIGFNTVLDRIGTQIDLLKIDCEGGEWEIFENPVPFQKVRSIRMEYHLLGGRTLDDLKKAAGRIGFEIVKLEQNSRFGIAWMESLKS